MSKFVIYTPDNKDYFVGLLDIGQGTRKGTGWDAIEKARMFRTFEQAQKMARSIANTMRGREDGYAIQICEVKEKKGRLKVEMMCEVPPDADRIDWYRDNPANVTKYDSPDAMPKLPEIAPVTFVLYREKTDDYLALLEQSSAVEKTGWEPHPEMAIRYATLEEAKAKAQYLVSANGYVLELRELHETQKQVWTRTLCQCIPTNPDPRLN